MHVGKLELDRKTETRREMRLGGEEIARGNHAGSGRPANEIVSVTNLSRRGIAERGIGNRGNLAEHERAASKVLTTPGLTPSCTGNYALDLTREREVEVRAEAWPPLAIITGIKFPIGSVDGDWPMPRTARLARDPVAWKLLI
ncbi:hypothetical protein K0M31_018691 [Melipona bicolor]|uniref:Uncharacterized protein n=1 Tax=Melipona bicolor TaxID=60889 RepID=A0AA40G435_9HYME|nr:hypothetical protein K0M31_018691 [Melipona bicolor]